MYTAQMASTPHYSLKAVSLGMVLAVGMVAGKYIPRTGVGEKSLSDCLGLACSLADDHILLMMSSNKTSF